MTNEWSKHGKKWRAAQMDGFAKLYGDAQGSTEASKLTPLINPPTRANLAKTTASGAVAKPKKPPRAKGERWLEKHEQMPLVHWARFLKQIGDLLMAIPNAGKRSLIGGQHEKMMGLVPGASDLFLAIARQGYHGYFIEMKGRGKKPQPNQLIFMELVRTQGFKAEWFDNFEKAKASIEEYLGI